MVTRKPLAKHAATDDDASCHLHLQEMRQELYAPGESESRPEQIWCNRPRDGQTDRATTAATRHNEGSGAENNHDVPDFLGAGLGAASSKAAFWEAEGNVWDDSRRDEEPERVETGLDVNRGPALLRPGAGNQKDPLEDALGIQNDFENMPTMIRPGGGQDAKKLETNPFKKKMADAVSGNNCREQLPKTSSSHLAPAESFASLSLENPSQTARQPASAVEEALASLPLLPMPGQALAKDGWKSAEGSEDAMGPASHPELLLSMPTTTDEPAGWGKETLREVHTSINETVEDNDEALDAHAWDDVAALDNAAMRTAKASESEAQTSADGWNVINVKPPSNLPPSQRQDEAQNRTIDAPESPPPPLPSRNPPDERPNLPPRSAGSGQVPPPPPRPISNTETYQIKNINWFDVSAAKNPRTSPILVQNANGPCPLMALVNALTLTTPADGENTALVETMRSREQISLGLLLDAVFDELMSPRRTRDGVDLPNVTEMYVFLQGLHTGMNVNPRFIPTAEKVMAYKRTSLTHVHPSERGDMIPGTFEDTREMDLYSTFRVPLIHGWLPAKDEAAYQAFERNAVSYEDAQNFLFREDELEEKLRSPLHAALTTEEQQVYQDVLTIRSFLENSRTQLTKWGLDVIAKALLPGAVAILFRNDHFLTLYRHPQTLKLLTLVTDAGYAGHAEVVWESLEDVNGEHAQFFSGEFRVSGGAASTSTSFPQEARRSHEDGHMPPQDNGERSRQWQPASDHLVPLSALEQQDRDLALAMQLQEEEEECHRSEQERRQRESALSEQYIEQRTTGGGTARGGGPPSPGRGFSSNLDSVPGRSRGASNASATRVTQQVRSLLPPRSLTVTRSSDAADDAPPSYEQAAKQTPFLPQPGHPSHPASSPGLRVASSAGTNGGVRAPAGGAGRGRGGGGPPPKEKDCVVM